MREVRFSSSYYDHWTQIFHTYQGPLDRVIKFFKDAGKPGDSCYIDNERDSLSYYTGMRLLHNKDILDGQIPDWIVLRGEHRFLEKDPSPVGAKLKNIIQSFPYQETRLTGPINRINNSYDIQLHLFQSPVSTDKILIYRLDPEFRRNL